jgi:hypothetical protein
VVDQKFRVATEYRLLSSRRGGREARSPTFNLFLKGSKAKAHQYFSTFGIKHFSLEYYLNNDD